MIRAAALGLAALVGAAPALAAEGGPIRGGEHDGFTRIVLTIEPTTEWSLESSPDHATILFPGKQIAFTTGSVFDKIPRSRVLAVRSAPGAAGTSVTVELGCDCRISTAFVGARYLALDIADRDATEARPEPAAETAAARAAREAVAVASAEQVLIRQIERAASQGLIEMADRGPTGEAAPGGPVETTEAEATPGPAPQATSTVPPPPEPPTEPARLEPPTGLEVLDHEQIQATTVFDRDSRRAVDSAAAPAASGVCLTDDRLDVAAWSNGLPLTAQLPPLRRQLIGEFDAASPVGLRNLARLYVRFGFGAEAESLLRGFVAVEIEDRALLVDLARAVEGRRATPDGPLAVTEPCPGRHGLWLALGGVASPFHDADGFASVHEAFAALPTDLRVLTGPNLIGRLLDAGHAPEARLIYDTAVRPGEPPDAALELAAARLAAAEGKPLEAAQALTALIEGDGHTSVEALTQLVRVVLDARLPIPDRVVTDLRAAALQYRGSDLEVELRRLLTEALARRAELPAALDETRAAMRELSGEAGGFAALAVRLLGEADPAAVGPAAYSETVLAAGDLVADSPAGDPARAAIAAHLVDLGLPGPALEMITPAVAAGDAAARLLAARAELRLGRADRARETLAPLEGPEAVALRAQAFALTGAYDQALATLADRGMAAEAAPYAWPSGDWSRARAASDDPERLAMASYMTVEAGEAEPPAPAPDPAALGPEAAFQEPLPALDRPSLDAARRLLSTGDKIGSFVQGVLDDARSGSD